MNERKRSSPPGYMSSEEAAEQLKVTKDRLYQWVKEGRLTSYNVGNAFIFLEQDIAQFERNPTGRKRKAPPPWRIYKGEVKVLATEIRVQVRDGQRNQLAAKVQAMQEANEYIFPGTIARYIMGGDKAMGHILILLVWKDTEMPNESMRKSQLALFQANFADVLDWQTAEIKTTGVLTHT